MPSGIAILFLILPAAMSTTTIPPASAAYSHLPSSDNARPLGQSSPVTHSAVITLPSRPILAIDPLPSATHGSPSMLDAYRTLRLASKRTDSGVLSAGSVSHSRV